MNNADFEKTRRSLLWLQGKALKEGKTKMAEALSACLAELETQRFMHTKSEAKT